MSLISRLRAAARQTAEIEIEHGDSDPAELVALIREIAEREGRMAECVPQPHRLGVLTVRFVRPDDA